MPRCAREGSRRAASLGVDLSAAPPLLPTGLLLRRDGRFFHEGEPVRNVRLQAAFRRGVRFLDDEGVWVVQLGRFRGAIEIEDTALFVDLYEAESGMLLLSDRSREPLRADTLRVGLDDALYCTVRERFAARFTQSSQAELLHHVEQGRDGSLFLRVDTRRTPLALVL